MLTLAVASALAAEPAQATWTASVDRQDVRRGEVVYVDLQAQVAQGWHLYSMTTPPGGPKPTVFSLQPGTGFEAAGKALQPKPETRFDENFQVDTEQYEGTVSFRIPIRIAGDAVDGQLNLRGDVAYQVCDPKQCVPGKFPWEVSVTVAPGEARREYAAAAVAKGFTPGTPVAAAKPAGADATAASQGSDPKPPVATTQGDASDVARARSVGLMAYLWLAINMGFLSLLTPCVFPMVPITVSYFTKQDGKSRRRGVLDAGIYSISIVITFTLLGLITSFVFGATGIRDFAANPWVNIGLAAVFVGLALNLFGFYEIVIPASILTPLSRVSGKGGFIGTLLMGVTFTITSFTCTVPFVGALLVSTAQGDWKWPLIGMLGYSMAFALPFFFLALFPQVLSTLPRAGGWMVSIKVVMGFLELAAALKFVSNVDLVWGSQRLTREAFLSIWIAIAVITSLYLLGKVRLPHERPIEAIGVPRMLFGTTFLAIAFYLFTGLLGSSLGELEAFLPPISAAQTGGSVVAGVRAQTTELVWGKDFDTAIAAARQSGKPLFIDFTGYACTNCRWMEKNIFPVPEVRDELNRYQLVQLFTDGQGPEYDRNRALQEQRFNTVALPLYVVIDPKDDREVARVEGLTRDPSEFVKFLRSSRETASAGVGAAEARVASIRK
ncbi:MAG TPA: cytochrome c biogenesis protein CcdA [Blastocatellia bacterium]|nr:cytochrome c biogenesis protein CcdA [Blastocatellia bacterium]